MIDFLLYHTPIFYLIQSVWRDEAFSYFMAKPSVVEIIRNTASDFNPPLYYILLHFWMWGGRSDEWLRLLSFLPHLGMTYISYLFAKKLFSRPFALFVALFTFFNPMLLYYAFEIRMYSFYAFFALCSLYFFYTQNWKWYIITSILGLYTHSFFPLILTSYLLFLWVKTEATRKNILRVLTPFLFYIPWVFVLFRQFLNSKDSWLFPVDAQLVKSVLGNLFTNYEGTPGNWWLWTAFLSLVIVLFFILGFRKKEKESFLFLIPIFVPLTLILGYSFFKRPLYVNRYMIFVTVFEIWGIASGIWSIRNKVLRGTIATFWIIFIFLLNSAISAQHKKTDFKTTFREINAMAEATDFVYTKTPIAVLESLYYYRHPQNVFVYNPQNITIPNYIGATLVFPRISKTSFPSPSRVFLVDDSAQYEIVIHK